MCIRDRAYVVGRLGAFQAVWEVGMHFKIPFIERVAKKVSLKEQVMDYPPQPVITNMCIRDRRNSSLVECSCAENLTGLSI